MAPIRLIAGLGNPGAQYQDTRHNVGADFVVALAERYRIPLAEEARFKGFLGRGSVAGHDVRLLVPTTYVNLSGDAVGAVARFFKLAPEEILVAIAPGQFMKPGERPGICGPGSVREPPPRHAVARWARQRSVRFLGRHLVPRALRRARGHREWLREPHPPDHRGLSCA